jgi:hypothetical protein
MHKAAVNLMKSVTTATGPGVDDSKQGTGTLAAESGQKPWPQSRVIQQRLLSLSVFFTEGSKTGGDEAPCVNLQAGSLCTRFAGLTLA